MAFPSLFALGGLTVAVLTRDVLGYSDLVINRGFGADVVARIALYQTVPLMAQMLPFAVLLGCLIGLGRLAADNELLILEASGVSSPRLLPPVMSFVALMALAAFALSLVASPWASRGLDASFEQMARVNAGATITAGKVHRFGDWKLEAREVSSRGDRMRGVSLWIPDIGETVFAENGALDPAGEAGTQVVLENGSLVLSPRNRTRELRFDRMVARLPENEDPVQREDGDALLGLTLAELHWASTNSSDRQDGEYQAARVELHRRFALPFATVVFGILVVPLFMSRAHFSRAGGGVLGIVTTVVYYGLIQLGDGLIQSGTLNAPLGVWLPNILLGIVGLVLMLRLKRMSAFGRDTDRPRSREPRRRTNRDDSALKLRRFALQRYVAGRFVAMVAFCFAVLLVAYLAVDILERLQIFARYNATGSVVLRFYGARIPLLASRVLPMALLVATALTVSLLAVQGELMGMKSCGISAPRALLPILVICAVIAPCYFLLSNEVLPRTNALASYLKEFEIKVEPLGERKHTDIWYRADHRIYQAERFDPQAGTARNITVYELGNDGLPVSRADARGARHIGGGVWRLVDPVRVQLAGLQFERVPAGPFADLGEAVPAEVDTRHLSVGELRREIREVEASGYDATVYRVDLWVKLAAPIACLVLPALALFFAVAGPPHPSSSLVLMLSVAVSVSYVLLTGVGTSLGYGGALPPIVAGWGPTTIFAALAVYFGLRLRGFGQGF